MEGRECAGSRIQRDGGGSGMRKVGRRGRIGELGG